METPLTMARFGPIWPDVLLAARLAMRQGVALFDCGGLITSGQERQTFNSLPFASISTHSYRLRGAGLHRSRLRGNDGLRRMRMYTTMVEGGVSKGQ